MNRAASSTTALHRAVSFMLLSLVLAGCASVPQWPNPVSSPSAAGERRLLDVPFHSQERYQCGPASLAMMLNAQGIEATPEALVERVYLPERQGALQVEMVAAARQFGLLVYPLERAVDNILNEINAGHPVLVLQNLRFGWWPQWHFAVVIGYDPQEETLILHSGTESNYEQPLPAFMATWDRAGRWARVMLKPDTLPATVEPLDFLIAANDLETTGKLDAAQTAYHTAITVWPEQPAALLGLGNIAYQREQWIQAAHYYGQITQRFPQVAAGWNNLGEALARQGCGLAAKTARRCAHKLAPERFPENTWNSGEVDQGHCPILTCP